MADILSTIIHVISPVFLVILVTAFIGRRFEPDEKTLSVLMIYLFTPSLVFRSFATTQLTGSEIGGIAGVAIGVALTMACIGTLVTRYAGWNREPGGSFVACIIMINAANYGIPLNTFAFGPEGADRAIAYYAIALIPGNILGIYFTSRGSVSVREAVKNVLTVPITYAAFAGIAVNAKMITLPLPVMRAVTDITANAAIPVMLALLGIKLGKTRVQGRIRPIITATVLRLVIAPCVAVPLALLFGLSGVTFKVAVVQSAMPTAVLVNVLATQFGGDGEFTSAVTLVTTLASILTLSILITLLMPGVPV